MEHNLQNGNYWIEHNDCSDMSGFGIETISSGFLSGCNNVVHV